MRLRADVRRITGATRHYLGTIIDGAPAIVSELQAPSYVEIEEGNHGFYLLYFDLTGKCITDGWHETIKEAKDQAEFEFEIQDADWTPIEEGCPSSSG